MMYNSCEDLRKNAARYSAALKAKFSGTDGRKHICLCGGTGCMSGGTREIKERFEECLENFQLTEKAEIRVVGCFGLCSQGPFVRIYPEDVTYCLVSESDIEEIVVKDIRDGVIVERLVYENPDTGEKIRKLEDFTFYKKQKRIALHGCGVIDPDNIEEALGMEGFEGLMKALSMSPEEVWQAVLDSGLRGRGGGGFPTGLKWKFAAASDSDEKYVVCNGDEGDPGAFMDRSILEDNPLAVIEGMAIAGYAIGAQQGYFYIRAEYPVAVRRVRAAIKMAEARGLLGNDILGTGFDFHAHVRLGAGAFVCGEETGLLNSIMGQRGMPRSRPPFPAVSGLWGKPTIVNNVETLATVPYILRHGAKDFRSYGTEKSPGTKVFCLGGKVNNVGLVEIPMGVTLRELVYDIGGGIQNGRKFKAIQTGGPSGGSLPTAALDTPIDFDNMVAAGSMMGSGGAIVMDEDNCMVDVARFYMGFIRDESCGKCAPCRIGTKRMLEVLDRITDGHGTMQDFDELEELAAICRTNSLCALGQTAANPIQSTIHNFRDEYIAHVVDKKCPAHVCKGLVRYSIDPELCRMCSACSRVCPVEVISGTPGKTTFVIDQEKCIKCGTCVDACQFNAIIVE